MSKKIRLCWRILVLLINCCNRTNGYLLGDLKNGTFGNAVSSLISTFSIWTFNGGSWLLKYFSRCNPKLEAKYLTKPRPFISVKPVIITHVLLHPVVQFTCDEQIQVYIKNEQMEYLISKYFEIHQRWMVLIFIHMHTNVQNVITYLCKPELYLVPMEQTGYRCIVYNCNTTNSFYSLILQFFIYSYSLFLLKALKVMQAAITLIHCIKKIVSISYHIMSFLFRHSSIALFHASRLCLEHNITVHMYHCLQSLPVSWLISNNFSLLF